MALWNFMDVPCALGTGFVREAHERFQKMQDAVMGSEDPPPIRTHHDQWPGRCNLHLESASPRNRQRPQQSQSPLVKRNFRLSRHRHAAQLMKSQG
jgi:hypothetical protein